MNGVVRNRIRNASRRHNIFSRGIHRIRFAARRGNDNFSRGGRIRTRDITAFQIPIQTIKWKGQHNQHNDVKRPFLHPKYSPSSLHSWQDLNCCNYHFKRQQQQHHQLFATISTLDTSSANDTSLTEILTSTAQNKNDKKDEEEEEAIYQELKSLSALLLQYDDTYYSPSNTTIISDDEYDALAARESYICVTYPHLLQKLEKESKLGKRATRHGGRVGFVLTESKERKKRKHLENNPMKSLDNALSAHDVTAWLVRLSKLLLSEEDVEQVEILGEPKLDGLSLSLRYMLDDARETYELTWGATRGDGTEGEDVTDAVLDMDRDNIPQVIPVNEEKKDLPDMIEVRGEVILPKSAFLELQQQQQQNGSNETEKGEKYQYQYSNARNAASGILLRKSSTMKQDDVQKTKELRSKLLFYAYDVVASFSQKGVINIGTKNGDITTGSEMREALSEMGFLVSTPIVVASPSLLSNETEEEEETELKDEELKKLLDYHATLSSLRQNGTTTNTTTTSFHEIDYDIDGAVYKLTSLSHRSTLGSSSRFPKWAIAHKFPPQCATTKLLDIIIQVGRKTGALTPVAVLEPVNLGGVVVSRASLHNFDWAGNILSSESKKKENGEMTTEKDEAKQKRWGRVKRNATVVVSRAGDVIPQVLSLVEDYNKMFDSDENDTVDRGEDGNNWISLVPPKTCPACDHTTIFERVENSKKEDDDNDESGRVLRCGGPQLLCPPRAVGALVHAYSRDALNVKGLSEARIEQLMDVGLITFPCDLFYTLVVEREEDSDEMEGREAKGGDDDEEKETTINTKIKEIADLPGWGPKSSQNLADMVQSVSTNGVSLSKFIYSLGIRHVGIHTAKLISASYGTVSAFLDDLEGANEKQDDEDYVPFARLVGSGSDKGEKEEDDGVKGIGPVMIKSLLAFSQEDALVKAAKDLATVILIHDDTTAQERMNQIQQNDIRKRPWDGYTVVFTGSLSGGMTRSEAQDIAVKLMGAKSTPGSVSKSTDLVVEGDKGGKKVDKAIELGVRVISGDEFIRLIEEYRS